MKKEETKSGIVLTLMFSLIVFACLLAAFLLIAAAVFVLIQTGVLTDLSLNESTRVLAVLLPVLVSLIIGAGISWLFSRIMAKPFDRITGTLQELAGGNFKARLDLGKNLCRYTAVKEFQDSINAMAAELDHTEILRADFVNNFSHEFKTPIVSIAGFARLLKRGNLTEAQRAEYTDIIEVESRRLSDMATGILNLTKIENQSILTDVTSFNLSEQIRGCVLLLEEKWTRKRILPEVDFDEVSIRANEEMLKQVWINLLDNAVKFAYEGAEVRVGIEKDGDRIRVSVSDVGSPIPPEDRERVFHKFYQTDRSHSAHGTGVGLAVVDRIVKLHRGEVRVSEEDGRTVFCVELPLDL